MSALLIIFSISKAIIGRRSAVLLHVYPSRLSHLFKACVCMEDGPAKPDPFPVAQAAKLIGVDPKDTALVRHIFVVVSLSFFFL